MEDKRQILRTRVLKGAKIMFDGHASTIDCTIRNLTTIGACLNVASPVGIPPRFDLSLDGGRTLRPCRVAWWQADRIGVAFEDLATETRGTPERVWLRSNSK